MNIRYLTLLNDNQTVNGSMSPGRYSPKTLEPMTMPEIAELETKYNNGAPFPIVLRELLLLAGKYCYVLDTGYDNTQDTLQQDGRDDLAMTNKEIARPFYIIDTLGGTDCFLFIYLDEGVEDPKVYIAYVYGKPRGNKPFIQTNNWTLSELINNRLQSLLKGYNPF